jgi:hypothetical protein
MLLRVGRKISEYNHDRRWLLCKKNWLFILLFNDAASDWDYIKSVTDEYVNRERWWNDTFRSQTLHQSEYIQHIKYWLFTQRKIPVSAGEGGITTTRSYGPYSYSFRVRVCVCVYTNVATGGRFFLDGHDKLWVFYGVVWFRAVECLSACSCSVRPLTFLWELSNARRSSWMEREGCFLLLDLSDIHFEKLSQNFEKRTLAWSCLSVCQFASPSVWNISVPTRWTFLEIWYLSNFVLVIAWGAGLVHSHSFSRKLHLACTNLM